MPGAIADHAEELLALEDRSAVRLTAASKRSLEAVGKLLLTEWARVPQPPSPADLGRIRATLEAALKGLSPGAVASTVDSIISASLQLGVDHALSEVDSAEKVSKPKPDPELKAVAKAARSRAMAPVAQAIRDLREARTLADFTRVMGRANQMRTSLERTARWVVNRAAAQGAAHVCSELGADKLWVAERDACVHCLAYSGKVAEDGEDFPEGLTFGDKALSTGPLPHPPLHPNCRCRITPWSGSRDGVGDVEMPEALEREARRSILRGVALPTEPQSVRVEAASKLLQSGVSAPATVKAAARRAVKAGRFG